MSAERAGEKLVVINADDLGFSADINATIEEGHRAGSITNATFMVDGAAVDDALMVIRRNPRLGVGLHLDLCPVTGFYDLPYPQMRAALPTPEMQKKVADEVTRQITRFQEFGLTFTHLDSHRHFHALPELFALVVRTAAAHGLKTIRLTKDWILPKTPSVYWDDSFLASATALLRDHGILYPGNFIYGATEYTADSVRPGLNELMVHVAYKDPYFFREYQRVSSKEFWRDLEKADVQTISYSNLAER